MWLSGNNKWRSIVTKTGILLCSVMLASACGFQLRGSQALPENLSQVIINAPLQYSPLSRAIQQRLPVYQLNGIINDGSVALGSIADNSLLLEIQPERFERRLLSVFSSGQVAEYELVYTIDYTVNFPSKLPISHSLSVTREYQDDPDQILAKSRELALVLDELRDESADRIIRLLSSQYATSIIDSELNQKAQ